jgi:hypothetical protein
MTQVYPVRDRHGVGKSGVTREARFGGFRYAKLRLRLKHRRMGWFPTAAVSWSTSDSDEHLTDRLRAWLAGKVGVSTFG